MKYWHLNTHTLGNKNHILEHNIGMIGLGIPKENRPYTSGNTIGQWERFKKNAKQNDNNILLYHNGLGYIAYGTYIKYNGPLHVENTDINILAPDWNDEIQMHIIVDKWILFTNISMRNPIYKAPIRSTLTGLSRGKKLLEYLLNNNE